MGIRRIEYISCNCSSLAASERFYTTALGFSPIANAPLELEVPVRAHEDSGSPGEGGGEGMRYLSSMLTPPDGQGSTLLELREYLQPRAVGKPYPSLNHLGIARVAILVENIEANFDWLEYQGCNCLSEPKLLIARPSDAQFCCVAFTDPDGSVLELVQIEFPASPESGKGSSRVFHANVNCSDLDASVDFYRDCLGLQAGLSTGFRQSTELGELLGLGPTASADLCMLSVGEDPGGAVIDLVQWREPACTGRPYDSANHLGISHIAFAVDSLDTTASALLASGAQVMRQHAVPSTVAATGPTEALQTWDPDGTCLLFVEYG